MTILRSGELDEEGVESREANLRCSSLTISPNRLDSEVNDALVGLDIYERVDTCQYLNEGWRETELTDPPQSLDRELIQLA